MSRTRRPSSGLLSVLLLVGGVGNTATLVVSYTVEPKAPALPVVTIGDGSVAEGNTGTKRLRLPVTLSAPASTPVTVTVVVDAGTHPPVTSCNRRPRCRTEPICLPRTSAR